MALRRLPFDHPPEVSSSLTLLACFPYEKYSFTRILACSCTRPGESLVYSLLVYFPLENTRLLVYSNARILSLKEPLVYSFTRLLLYWFPSLLTPLLVYSFTGFLVYSFTPLLVS
jgi:hypothetical protein